MSMTITQAAAWPEVGVRHPVSVEEFGRMAEAGVFDPEARLELIDGEILEMSPIGAHHAYAVRRLERILGGRQLEDRGILSVQSPIVCGRTAQPQPDLAVATWPDRYVDRHPTAAETLLIIEVSDTTARLDRNRKIPLYGRSGIREAWLVDMKGRRVEVYTHPTDKGYAPVDLRLSGELVVPTAFPDVEIAVADLLPPQSQASRAGK